MRILQVATSLGTGGVQGQVAVLARGLAARGHDVRVLGLYGEETLDLPGIRQLALGLAPGDQAQLARAVPLVRRAASAFAPDVVHSHAFHATFASRLAGVGAPWPLVSTVHSAQEGGALHRVLARATFGCSDVVTVVGEAARAANEASGAAPRGRLRVVRNGLDLARLPEPADREGERAAVRAELGVGAAPMVLAVGRLTAAKDYPTLLAATARLRTLVPGVRVLVAGDGEERDGVERAARDLRLGTAFTLLGTRTDVPRLLRAADVFVMSSAWEGLPLVAAEAMWARTRLVVTDVPGILEVAGGHALVAPRGDGPALAEAVAAALAEAPTERAAATAAARERVEAVLSADRMLEGYQDVYREVTLKPSLRG